MPFYTDKVHLPCEDDPTSSKISKNTKFCPFLKTHCHAISDFDMIFQYVFSRWDGSTAYSTMFQEARITDLLVPRDKYYLANAGFAT